jgi:acyl dehydratase
VSGVDEAVASRPSWAGVEVGEELRGCARRLDWTSLALQVSGSQDWNRVHHDPDYARDSGHDQVFFNTGWTAAMLSRLCTDWSGPSGWLRHLDIRMNRMNSLGDTVSAHGRVVEKRAESDGRRLIVLDVWLENPRQGVTTTGMAVVEFLEP